MWAPLVTIQTILGLARTCDKCGNSQVVPSDKRHKTVKCERCGKELPPKKPN